jgi:hypothetical protein
MNETKKHWVDVPVLMREASWDEFRPADEVWYFTRRGKRYGSDACGPFVVLAVGPGFIRLRNQNGVPMTFTHLDRLLPLKRVTVDDKQPEGAT